MLNKRIHFGRRGINTHARSTLAAGIAGLATTSNRNSMARAGQPRGVANGGDIDGAYFFVVKLWRGKGAIARRNQESLYS